MTNLLCVFIIFTAVALLMLFGMVLVTMTFRIAVVSYFEARENFITRLGDEAAAKFDNKSALGIN